MRGFIKKDTFSGKLYLRYKVFKDQGWPVTPICVDLDDTFIKTDALHEYLISAIKKSPIMFFKCIFWLLKGRSYLKSQLVRNVQLNIDQLPYNEELIEFLKDKSSKGRGVYLVSASNTDIVQKVIRKFDFFSGGYGSTESLNLKGENKASFLAQEFGEKGFDYIGDCAADIPIWKRANECFLVGPKSEKSFSSIKFTKVFKFKKNSIGSMIKAMRVYQWAKNLLIFAPMILAHKYTDSSTWINSVLGFVSFSFMASSIYLLNDLADMPADRDHYKKKNRPLASGSLSIPRGIILLITLITTSFYISSYLPSKFCLILVGYTVLNLGYSFKLKKVPIVDVILLSAFYMIRLEAGSAASEIYLTQWLIIFALFTFASLGFLKRYCELLEQFNISGKVSVEGRGYNTKDLSMLLSSGNVTGQLSVLCFLLYLFMGGAAKYYGAPKILLLNGIFYFYWITTLWFKATRGKVSGDPVKYSITDKASLIVGIISVINILFAKYFDTIVNNFSQH